LRCFSSALRYNSYFSSYVLYYDLLKNIKEFFRVYGLSYWQVPSSWYDSKVCPKLSSRNWMITIPWIKLSYLYISDSQEQKQLVAFHSRSPRLYRIVVLCVTGIILAFSIGLNGFQGPEIALQSRIIRRSELNPLDSYLDQNSSYTPPVKRAFDQAAWDKALNKYGKPAITCDLPANNPGKPNFPTQSQWQDTGDLGKNGVRVTTFCISLMFHSQG
jgi:hypothetical protein